MAAPILQLPGEIRNEIYKLLLLQRGPLVVGRITPPTKSPHLDLGILGVNKVIHREASSLFYGVNCFDFTNGSRCDSCDSSSSAAEFLAKIGPTNAGYIKDIAINLPSIEDFDTDNEGHEFGFDLKVLEAVHKYCPNVRTIKVPSHLYVRFGTQMFERSDIHHWVDLIPNVLKFVDRTLRGNWSLQTVTLYIVIWDSDLDIYGYAMRKCGMEKLGWNVEFVEWKHFEGTSEGTIEDTDESEIYPS